MTVQPQLLYQIYNSNGKIVYRFESYDAILLFNLKEHGFNLTNEDLQFLFSKRYLFFTYKGQDFKAYHEEQCIERSDLIIDQLAFNGIKVPQNLKANFINYGYQYTNALINVIKPPEKLRLKPNYPTFEPTESVKTGLGSSDGGLYDDKGNSDHYQKSFMEFIRKQERAYGTIVAYIVCVAMVDKYAERAGEKVGVDFNKDFIKKTWYSKTANHFKKKILGAKDLNLNVDGRNNYVFLTEEVVDVLKTEIKEIKAIDYVTLSVAIEK